MEEVQITEVIKAQLESTRQANVNFRGEKFVPYESLNEILSANVIRKAIQSSVVEVYYREETIRKIENGAKRILAILIKMEQVELIRNFITNDHLVQDIRLDHKLPLSLDHLQEILQENFAVEFYTNQWEFIVPSFVPGSSHREFKKSIVLPFTTYKMIGSGGFGSVYDTGLQVTGPGHGSRITIVCKELNQLHDPNKDPASKQLKSSKPNYEEEIRCLTLLNFLKHPNISELVASFTYEGKHRLLFPMASEGDLSSLFSAEKRPSQFEKDSAFYVALSGLASALESVHTYTCQVLDLNLIGCHHDLKPKNILVDASRFILSDFGLSRLQDPGDSKYIFKSGEGYYLAPECINFETPQKHPTGRPSDIWSFGCLIADLFTYIKKGATGVREFVIRRKTTVKYTTIRFFHAGPDSPNEGVADWLSDFEQNGTDIDQVVVCLIKDILKMKPEHRPTIEQVSTRVRFVAIISLAQRIDALFSNLPQIKDNLEAVIEYERFKTWLWRLWQLEKDVAKSPKILEANKVLPDREFQAAVETLSKIEHELNLIERLQLNVSYPLFFKLRRLNDELLSIYSLTDQMRIRSRVESTIMAMNRLEFEDESEGLEKLESSPIQPRIATLATIKRMSAMALESSKSSLSVQIDKDSIEEGKPLEDMVTHYLSKYANSLRRVLVEWIPYGAHWTDEKVGQELFDRMEMMAAMAQKASTYNNLRCSGFYHAPTKHAFGLVFDFPLTSGSIDVQNTPDEDPVTLGTIIKKGYDKHSIKAYEKRGYGEIWMGAPLGRRFQLAHKLAVSVFEFHKVGWLHKTISSYTVLFFSKEHAKSLESAYLIGLSHSRPSGPNEFTEGVAGQGTDLRDYQHPRYLYPEKYGESSINHRYRPLFDYYSLGLVLLEIGLWRSLNSMTKGLTPEETPQNLLEKQVPRLGPTMGDRYRDAVEVCISGKLGQWENPDHSSEVDLNFEQLVIERLVQCSA